jgi:hypothetical protein
MKSQAINQAREKLRKAQHAVGALRGAATYVQASDAWADFLVPANTVFQKLKRGAVGYGRSEGWFNRVLQERRGDPLLSYVQHARNVDEHGIEPISKVLPGGFRGGVIVAEADGLRIRPSEPGGPASITLFPPRLVLVAVVDRGVRYDVPTAHLGVRLVDPSPLVVAELAQAYLERLIEAAEGHVVTAGV